MPFGHNSWPAVIFALLTSCGVVYSLLCLAAAWSFLRRPSSPSKAGALHSARSLAVSILKPLKGCDPQMYESFRSHCLQDYPEFEIIFGVNAADDEAAPLVERLMREFPQHQIRLVVCSRMLGANGKVSSLVQMLEHARYPHIIINDSDIRVPADYLRDVMREFSAPANTAESTKLSPQKVGMVTCFYRAVPARSLWSRLEALGVAADFIPGALAARLLEGRVRFGLGSTLAVSLEALKAIGGMEPLLDYLADDYELANRMVNAGYRVEVPHVVVETFLPDYDFAQYFRHQLRWGRTVRSSRPGGYAGLIIVYGMLWALLCVVLTRGAAWAWALTVLVLLLRGSVLLASARSVLGDKNALGNFWLMPILDLISPMVWLLSITGNRIVWRGEKFVLKEGKLQRVGVSSNSHN